MQTPDEIKKCAARVMDSEARAIDACRDRIGDDFAAAVELILQSAGRVVVTGIGKSANIANKMVATFNSTGTASVFMHAADAIHGDLGTVQKNDIVLCLSKSGNTPEIKALLPLIKTRGNKLIAITGNTASYLAGQSDLVLDAAIEEEACPNNLAPTTSTTVQLALGDALAICLLECRGFSTEDFAQIHPGGALGKQLYLRVSDIYTQNEKPEVPADADIKTTILEISSKRLGATAVTEGNKLIGIVTDGDLRRMLEKGIDINTVTAKDIMSPGPRTIDKDDLAIRAMAVMEKHNITQLLVTDGEAYAGVVHLHDLLKEGIL